MFLPLNTSPFIFLAFHVLENLSGAASTQISLKKLFAQIFKTRSRSGWASGLDGCPCHLRGPFREHPGLGMWASPNPAGPFTTKPRLQASQSTTFAMVAEPSKKSAENYIESCNSCKSCVENGSCKTSDIVFWNGLCLSRSSLNIPVVVCGMLPFFLWN
jgi:hypothetical protein